MDSARIEGLLLEQIDSFEKRKVLDLKAALKEFVNIELAFHAKALEVLTEAYQSVQGLRPFFSRMLRFASLPSLRTAPSHVSISKIT